MKKAILLFLLLPIAAFSQIKISADILRLSGIEVNGIRIDTILDDATDKELMSARAIKGYVDNNSGGGGNADLSFDSDRPILRELSEGVTVGGTTIVDVLEYMYFAPPTMTLNRSPATSVYEVGTSNNITYSGATSNAGNATLSGGELVQLPSTQLLDFGASVTYTHDITYAPTSEGIIQLDVFQDWVKGAESGTASAAASTTYAVYPILYGVSSTDYSSTGDIYAAFTKLVQREGDKSITFNGTGFLYIAIPDSWNDVVFNEILDHNGFNVTSSFTVFDRNVSSSGLTNNYSNIPYKLYKLNNQTTANNNTYEFNQ